MNNKTVKKGLFPYVFLFCFIIVCLLIFQNFNTTVNNFTYDEFIKELDSNEIKELNIVPKTRSETYEITGKLKDYDENETFTLTLPKSDEFISKITDAADKNKFTLLYDKLSNEGFKIMLIERSNTGIANITRALFRKDGVLIVLFYEESGVILCGNIYFETSKPISDNLYIDDDNILNKFDILYIQIII